MKRKGQMFVGMVLMIGSIIAIAAFLLLFVSGSLVNTSYAIKADAVAQAAATAGAQDAMLQITRGSIATYPTNYSLPVGSTTANVYVANNVPSSGFLTVTSTASYVYHTKTVRVVLSVNGNSQVNVVSWQQVQ